MVKSIQNIIQEAKKIVFFTGAGISAESGIPTFRGENGLWENYNPKELATPKAFKENPNLVWRWYEFRREIIRNAEPNIAHKTIVKFEKFAKTYVITQNVDNLHNRAGSKNILELHGNIEKNFCSICGKRYDFIVFEDKLKAPICEECKGFIRPDIVWFGEMLPQEIFRNAIHHAENCDVCFVVGTSGVVFPAANIPISAKKHNAIIVEINLESTNLSEISDFILLGKASEILPEIFSQTAKPTN